MSNNEITIKYKTVIFGKEGVGKTSLVKRLVSDAFSQDYTQTIGYNVYEKMIMIENVQISLVIYDFGGQQQFAGIRKTSSEGADTAILVYDISDKESFEVLSKWRMELFDVAGDIPFIIIGNKNDLEKERQVPKEMGEEIIKKLGGLSFIETSAKTGDRVEEAFHKLAKVTLDKYSQ